MIEESWIAIAHLFPSLGLCPAFLSWSNPIASFEERAAHTSSACLAATFRSSRSLT